MKVFENLEQALTAAQSDLSSLLKLTVYLADLDEFEELRFQRTLSDGFLESAQCRHGRGKYLRIVNAHDARYLLARPAMRRSAPSRYMR